MQEAFKPNIKYFAEITEIARRLVRACPQKKSSFSGNIPSFYSHIVCFQIEGAKILDIPLVVTEQKGVRFALSIAFLSSASLLHDFAAHIAGRKCTIVPACSLVPQRVGEDREGTGRQSCRKV